MYLFTSSNSGKLWSEVSKMKASDYSSGDRFGISVFLSSKVLAVGAYMDDVYGGDSGTLPPCISPMLFLFNVNYSQR